jgi:serine/threonine protein kinase/transcriptional regulator with XRE-family HTH domain
MSTDSLQTFGESLSSHRIALGLTQEELAERSGLSVRGISDLERGARTQPRLYTVRQLADALGLAPAERTSFEQSAVASTGSSQRDHEMAAGNFLGALPANPLVARNEELTHIRSMLAAVTESAGQLLLLGGESGAGKTRLLQEITLEARERNFMILTGRCEAAAQQATFYPFLQALADLIARLPVQIRSEGQRIWRRVQKLTSDDSRGQNAAVGDPVRQHDLFNAVSTLLMLGARASPLALLIDDLQWADPGSVKLLQHLARSTHASPILLAGAYCDLRLAEEHPELAQLLQTVSRERLAERLVVRRLSLEETTTLLEVTMEEPSVSEEFASFVYRRTKGNPRLVERLVRSLGGRLELEGEIGAGSTGRVFRAFDRDTERTVAAKLVLARSEVDLDALLRFQQEGAVLAKLDHPHIVDIYDTFAEEHATCIIMELLEGESLGQILQHGPLSLTRSRAIALQVADALSYAHSQEIVHRDIKPDNVMVLPGDQIKVTDFGIARLLQPDTSLHTIATTGMRMGTPLYMAPEQIEGKRVDGRTDVYALGAMLFHMATGKPPFEGSDALAIAVKHLQDVPTTPSSIDPSIPPAWDALILKAMAKEPDKRFRSARELRDAIALLSEKGGIAARTNKRGRLQAALVGLAVAVLAIAIGIRTHSTTAAHSTSLSSRIDGFLSGLASRHHFSGSVLVARHGSIVLDKGYGWADQQRRLPNTANTPYPVGGVSASFAELLALQLIAAGTLHWQTPICTYVPHCPATWKPVTVRMVLNGTAELPNFDWGRVGNSTQQSIVTCQSEPLDGPIGSAIDYQNCGTLVLGVISEKLSGAAWESDIASTIFHPAGMRNSGRVTDAWALTTHAHDYAGTTEFPDTVYNDYFAAYSTARDVYAYDNALMAGKLLPRSYLHFLFTPRAPVGAPDLGIRAPRWGYVWRTGVAFGHRVVYTSSGTKFFQTINLRFIDDGVTVIVISNDHLDNINTIAVRVAAFTFAKSTPTFRAPSNPALPALLGTYRRTFRAADWKAVHDPSIKMFVGGTITIAILRNSIHFALLNNQPDSSSDEYYQASQNGHLTLMGYLPFNQNNLCSANLHEASPNGYYHWARQNGFLVITHVKDDGGCPDRAGILTGRWTKVK